MLEPYKDISNKKIVITYSKAVLNDKREIEGVIGIYRNLDKLSGVIKKLYLGNNSFGTNC